MHESKEYKYHGKTVYVTKTGRFYVKRDDSPLNKFVKKDDLTRVSGKSPSKRKSSPKPKSRKSKK